MFKQNDVVSFTLNIFHTFFSVSTIDLELVNHCWGTLRNTQPQVNFPGSYKKSVPTNLLHYNLEKRLGDLLMHSLVK